MPDDRSHPKVPPKPPASQRKGEMNWHALAKGHKRNLVSLDRPGGVTFACVANVLLAIIYLVILLMSNAQFMVWFGGNELSPGLYLFDLFMVSVFLVIAAFGMWEGATWSWWMMVILQGYCLFDYVGGMIVNAIFHLPNQLQSLSGAPLRLAKDIAYSILYFVYFFTDDVLAFFSRTQEKKLSTGGKVLLIVALLVAGRLALGIWLRKT